MCFILLVREGAVLQWQPYRLLSHFFHTTWSELVYLGQLVCEDRVKLRLQVTRLRDSLLESIEIYFN